MNSSLVTLKLVLDELGVSRDVSTLPERKKLQKVVYLTQAKGLNLGYSYGWYLRGPYSPRLTRDYFALDEELAAGKETVEVQLKPAVREMLAATRPLLEVPEDVGLPQPDWLELLASLRYLSAERRLQQGEADEILKREKPRLVPFVDRGRAVLAEAGLN